MYKLILLHADPNTKNDVAPRYVTNILSLFCYSFQAVIVIGD
jgi:hypothetical protein